MTVEELPILTKTKQFPIIEIFGPTVQGEGALAGTVSHFVRFGGCDFRCAWCDSDHAVLPEKVRANSTKMDAVQIAARIRNLPTAEWVTLSGGNPAMHKLDDLVSLLGKDFLVATETQGTHWKEWLAHVDMLTVSPKPPSSGMDIKTREALPKFMDLALDAHTGPTICLKVPVHGEEDLGFLEWVRNEYRFVPLYVSVVTEMGGLDGTYAGGHIDSNDDLIARWRWVTERILEEPARFPDVRIIPQLHTLLWSHERGH